MDVSFISLQKELLFVKKSVPTLFYFTLSYHYYIVQTSTSVPNTLVLICISMIEGFFYPVKRRF